MTQIKDCSRALKFGGRKFVELESTKKMENYYSSRYATIQVKIVKDTIIRIVKFSIGLAAIGLVFGILGFGRLPGGVITHNLKEDIDASPLFYTEVENFWEIEHR